MTSPKTQLESAREGNITDELQFFAEPEQLPPDPISNSLDIVEVEQPSDLIGQSDDQVDNADAIPAIENDPPLSPKSS